MAKLPFQQTQVLPGAEVGAFKSSGITPPPSLQGVIDSGTQFYGAQMDVAESMMDLGQTIAKAVMIDKNEKERKRKIEFDDFEDAALFDLEKRLMEVERKHEDNPAAYDNILKSLLKTRKGAERPLTDADGRSYLETYEDRARERGFTESEVRRLSQNMQRLGIRTNIQIWRAARDQEEMRYGRKRTNAENNAVNDFVRQLQRDEIDLYTKESTELAPEKIQGLENQIETLVNKIVTVENGYTGKNYPDPEDLTDARNEVRTRLRNLLITKEGKWNHLELENRLREANEKETQAHTRAEARLVEAISDSMVLEIADQNQDYSYQRDDIKNQIPIVVSEEGYRIYPVDRDQYGVDKNAAKRSDWIQKTNEALELRYFDENLQLRIDAARRSVQFRKEEEQEESRIKSLDNTTRRREASLLLGEQITILEDQFGKGEINAETAKKRAKQYAEKLYDLFTRKRKGTAPQSEEDKLFNKNLNVDLQGEISAENRGWVRSERLEAEALDKEQKAIERDERAKHLRKKTNEAATNYAKQAGELFLEQQENPKPHQDFERSLEAVKANIIRDFAGDAPDEEIGEEISDYDQELAESIDAELSNVVIQDWYQVASRQKSDAITLEASQASIDYIYGKDGKPGLNRILEEAFNRDEPWDKTSEYIDEQVALLQQRTTAGLSEGALQKFENSSEFLEHKEAKVETLRNQVTEREDQKLKVSLERRMNDVATGRDLGQFKAPPRTFRDAQNLLTNRQESDWRMVHIANLLEEHVGDVDGLYSRDEAIQILGKYAERIDRADALGLIDRDPIAAEKALAPVKQGDLDALFPNLQPDERERLKIQAGNSIQQGRTGSKADIRNQFNNEIKRVLAGDYQYDQSSEMLDGSDPTFMERIVKPLVGSPEQGGLYEQWEYEVMQSKMDYAKAISKAVHGGNPKYGNERLEYKTAEQLQALLADFKPGTFDAGFVEQGKRYDRGFMDEVYNSFAQGVGQILTKRQSDPAFYPAQRWSEMMEERGVQVNMFSRERAEYIMEQQEAFAPGSEPKLFTNAELEGIDAEWNDADSLGRAGMLNEMQQTVSDQTMFSQMFDDVAENTSINYSDQLYLEHKDNGAILRRLQIARQLNMSDINTKLGTLETDLETFDVELFENEELSHFLAAFSDEPNRMADWYQLVRSYAVTEMRDDDSDKAVTESVQQLLSSKYHVHSGDPYEDDIEGSSIWIPKQFIPDRPADMGGLMEEQTRFEPITKDDFTKSLQRFVKDEVPALVGKNTYAASAAGNYHFRNSDDGQGLTLHFFSEVGSYPVPDKEGNEIQLNWDQLRNLVFDVRSLGYKAGRIPKERVDLRLRSYQEQMQQGNP